MRFLNIIWLYPLSLAVSSWLLMLFIGVIHGEWLPAMPTIGYWDSVLISLMLSALVGGYTFWAGVGKALFGES